MYIALRPFKDKFDNSITYEEGDTFVSDDAERVKNAIKRGFIEESKVSSSELTKKDIINQLLEKGIEFKQSDTKVKLLELLEGGV